MCMMVYVNVGICCGMLEERWKMDDVLVMVDFYSEQVARAKS